MLLYRVHRRPLPRLIRRVILLTHIRCSVPLPGADSWPCFLHPARAFVVKHLPALLVVDEEDNQPDRGEDAVASSQTFYPRRARVWKQEAPLGARSCSISDSPTARRRLWWISGGGT